MQSLRSIALAGALILAFALPAAAQSNFIRGDCNIDGGLDISDSIFLLGVLFGGAPPSSCPDACDGNDDGNQDIGDAVYGLSFLFSGGAPPAAPFPACGADPTGDPLGCPAFPLCPLPVEDCDNAIDDDGDGATDCLDSDCAGDPACAVLSHDLDIQPIWDVSCTLCHAGPNPFAGLDLSPGAAYADIFGVASSECGVLDRIDPFSPATSWLYRKVMGTHTDPDITSLGCVPPGTGNSMPPGAFCCITPAEELLIEQWILQGAAP